MKPLKAEEIRTKFLDFFVKNNHLLISPSPLVPINDPTLLFINSGMAPLKKYFMGIDQPPEPRLCNFQPCIRTRDIDDVGDRHHMTMFEMLGSWSIGDYYKQVAVELAWKLLVEELKFPPSRLYFTVYGGNKKLGLTPDHESAKAWKSVGVPEDRIIFLGEDNFWGPAGDTGPCGPCTEVFFDTGEEFGETYVPGKEFDTSKRYIEIWNAGVFMEFNKNKDGSFIPLPLKSVDTGSGLERMEFVMNGCRSVYETSGLAPILNTCKKLFPSESFSEKEYRILTDHIRAACFIVSEKVKPSNEGQGYIPRRLIRKCVAIIARSEGKIQDLKKIIDLVIDISKQNYPHLLKNKDIIHRLVLEEATSFEPIIKKGFEMIEEEIKINGALLKGKFIFDMVATFGVPFDLIQEFSEKNNVKLETKVYQELFEEHQNISRNLKSPTGEIQQKDFFASVNLSGVPATSFLGYQKTKVNSKVKSLYGKNFEIVHDLSTSDEGYLITEETTFYAESGGQVGDTGTVYSPQLKGRIMDTQKSNGIFVHRVIVDEGTLKLGSRVDLEVDEQRRSAIQKNHSATHLLHGALRKILSGGALQKGSLVDDKRLRFDFQHDQALSPEQITKIEWTVNEWIQKNIQIAVKETDIHSAMASGAVAMFGEKYGDVVRVIEMGPDATELCGGTHAQATGNIGLFVITSEGSVGKGIRRIEATTGLNALHIIQAQKEMLVQISKSLKVAPQNLIEEVLQLKEKLKSAQKSPVAGVELKIIREKSIQFKGLHLNILEMDGDVKILREAIEKKVAENQTLGAAIVLSSTNNRATVLVCVRKKDSSILQADQILNILLQKIEGKGGGKPTFAQGAGSNMEALNDIFENIEKILK